MAGARGTTLGDAATEALEAGGTVPAGMELTGCRCGGGGGAERNAPGAPWAERPRAEGGGGIRELSGALPLGRGTTLTGRGATLAGATSTG